MISTVTRILHHFAARNLSQTSLEVRSFRPQDILEWHVTFGIWLKICTCMLRPLQLVILVTYCSSLICCRFITAWFCLWLFVVACRNRDLITCTSYGSSESVRSRKKISLKRNTLDSYNVVILMTGKSW